MLGQGRGCAENHTRNVTIVLSHRLAGRQDIADLSEGVEGASEGEPMSWRLLLTIGTAFIALVSCSGSEFNPPPQLLPDDSIELARWHAPIIFQDTRPDGAEADYITAFDYDDNRTADDNWDHLGSYADQLLATVYYSVVESDRYWFIVYAFFHPRDWRNGDNNEHENDMEGILAIVLKDDTEFGRLIGAITVAHTNFYSYTPEGSPLREGHEDIDGTLSTMSWNGAEHAKLSIETGGHPVWAWSLDADFTGEPGGGDGIIYRPARSPSDAARLSIEWRRPDCGLQAREPLP